MSSDPPEIEFLEGVDPPAGEETGSPGRLSTLVVAIAGICLVVLVAVPLLDDGQRQEPDRAPPTPEAASQAAEPPAPFRPNVEPLPGAAAVDRSTVIVTLSATFRRSEPRVHVLADVVGGTASSGAQFLKIL